MNDALPLRKLVGLAVVFLSAALLSTMTSTVADGTTLDEEHARSDHFWRIVSPNGMPAETYETPADMARAADLIVVGTIAAVERGRE